MFGSTWRPHRKALLFAAIGTAAVAMATSAIAAPNAEHLPTPSAWKAAAPVEQPPAPQEATGELGAWGNAIALTNMITVPAAAKTGTVSVRAGGLQAIALKSDGNLITWGNNTYDQSTIPADAIGASAVASGWGTHLALKGGRVIAWGNNFFGQVDVPPQARSGITAIESRAYECLALTGGGEVVSWGLRKDVPAEAKAGVTAISAGGDHNLALKNGGVIAWGSDNHGQSTVPAAARSGVKAISAGGNHNLALKDDGSVVAWGSDEFGQSTLPPEVTGAIAVAAGGTHSVAVLADGKTVAWGQDFQKSLTVPPEASSAVREVWAVDRVSLFLK